MSGGGANALAVRQTRYTPARFGKPEVTYALTEFGQSLKEPVEALGQEAIQHIGCIRAAQQRFDARHDEAA